MADKTIPEQQLDSSKKIELLLTRISAQLDELIRVDVEILVSQTKLNELELITREAARR